MASPIRVLHCIHSLSGGGAEKQLRILVKGSAKQAIEVGIFCVNDKGNDIQDASVRIYRSRHANKYSLRIFGSLNAAIDDFKPDVLHAWLPGSVTIPAMVLALKNRLPCVFSYRVAMFFGRPLAVIEYVLALFAASRIVTNNSVKQSNAAYRFLYRLKDGVQIRNAVLMEPEHRDIPDLKSTDELHKVLFVGRITQQKNWACLLRAFSLVDPRFRVRLVVCGEGEEKEQFLAMGEKLAVAEKVQYLGYQQNIYQIMRSCDMLVLPSWYEGMPNVLLEALSIGLPCIVSDIPAHRDIIGDTGCALLFDPSNPKELAVLIGLLSGDQTTARGLAERGKIVAQDYRPERMVREYRELYSSIATKSAANN